ncbi:small hydrophobic protein membrane protein [Streptomyces laurentii]|uniref:Small hydrophobic protein membrane protein n=1 Tax=Streptomyces laurentii TaxID=39478 RepID=A0A160P592_STRLU|nr:small hydrophobic protein membrane protein [Streptomyces laurentii]
MGVWQLLLIGLVMLLGLFGVLTPGVPGTWLVWAAVLWWSLHERTGPAWILLVSATGLLLLTQVAVWQLPPRRFRGAGVTRRTMAYAGAGALLGFVLIPVIGAIPGFVGGVYLSERLRAGGHGQARTATRTVMRAAGTSVLVELFACLLIMGAWVGVLVLD